MRCGTAVILLTFEHRIAGSHSPLTAYLCSLDPRYNRASSIQPRYEDQWICRRQRARSLSGAASSAAASPTTSRGAAPRTSSSSSARRSALAPRARRPAVSASSSPPRPRSASRLEAIRVFERFQDEFGVDPGYKKIGYLFLISEEHLALRAAHRASAKARRRRARDHAGRRAKDRAGPSRRRPDRRGVGSRRWAGRAGRGDRRLCAARARAGVKIVEGVRVSSIERSHDRVRVTTSAGRSSAINAAGPSAARVARLAGVGCRYPGAGIFFTEPFPAIPGPVPLTTDVSGGLLEKWSRCC